MIPERSEHTFIDRFLDKISTHEIPDPLAFKRLPDAPRIPNSFPIEAPNLEFEDRYQEMITNFVTRHMNPDLKSIAVVGVTEGVGTSTTTLNFAASLARDSGPRVLLIDGNLRNPGIYRQFKGKMPYSTSLADLLDSNVPSVCSTEIANGMLYALLCDSPSESPSSVFRSRIFENYLQYARAAFDLVVVDGPPIAKCPESLQLCNKVDGVILVAEAGRTRKQLALWAKEQIEKSGGNILGVVLNKTRHYIPDWIYRRL